MPGRGYPVSGGIGQNAGEHIALTAEAIPFGYLKAGFF